MTEEVVFKDQPLLILNNKIVAIGRLEDIKVPKGTKIIDGKGKFLIPGLSDIHTHIYR